MIGYFALLALIAPVFLLVTLGAILRWKGVLNVEAERSIVTLVVRILYPCLVLRALIQADPLREAPGIVVAPVFGFLSVCLGFAVSALVARLIGLRIGSGLRTFCFCVGIFNYGYFPVPITQSLFGVNELATLFAHNVGVELALWTVGLAIITRASLQQGLRSAANPMSFALLIGLGLNVSGVAGSIPGWATVILNMLGDCAIPLGLVAIGGTFYELLTSGDRLWDARENCAAVLARLAILPVIGLFLAWLLPVPLELKHVLVIQAAMPAGVMPIVLAKRYGGQPLVAARVVISTTAVGLIVMPLWIDFGLRWVLG